MTTIRDIRIGELIALMLLPVAIVIVRVWFNRYYPRDEFCWEMISWALSALAFSTVVVAVLCAITGKRIADLAPAIIRWTLYVVWLGGSAIVALFGFVSGLSPSQVVVAIAGWLAVSLSLLALLALPRLQKRIEESHNKPTGGDVQ